MLPAGSSGARPAYAGCHSFAIPREAANRAGAARLLQFLTSFEAQLLEARQGAIPCRVSALSAIRDEQADDAAASERWQLLAAQVETMIVPPRFAAYPLCEDAIWRAAQQAMLGHLSPASAIDHAAAAVAALVPTS
jgi:multiple sugar transport system substrate-binding protein